jgi:hypothetical protein
MIIALGDEMEASDRHRGGTWRQQIWQEIILRNNEEDERNAESHTASSIKITLQED